MKGYIQPIGASPSFNSVYDRFKVDSNANTSFGAFSGPPVPPSNVQQNMLLTMNGNMRILPPRQNNLSPATPGNIYQILIIILLPIRPHHSQVE